MVVMNEGEKDEINPLTILKSHWFQSDVFFLVILSISTRETRWLLNVTMTEKY
jgi:hypothetical protein